MSLAEEGTPLARLAAEASACAGAFRDVAVAFGALALVGDRFRDTALAAEARAESADYGARCRNLFDLATRLRALELELERPLTDSTEQREHASTVPALGVEREVQR